MKTFSNIINNKVVIESDDNLISCQICKDRLICSVELSIKIDIFVNTILTRPNRDRNNYVKMCFSENYIIGSVRVLYYMLLIKLFYIVFVIWSMTSAFERVYIKRALYKSGIIIIIRTAVLARG